MSTLPDLSGGQGKFLTKRQKQIGNVAVAGGGVVVAAGIYKALPAIVAGLGLAITATSQLIVLGTLLGVVAIGGYILLSPGTWRLVKAMRMTVAQKAADVFIRHNAIDYMKAFADEYLEVKYRLVTSGLRTIVGKVSLFEERIRSNEEKLADARKRAAFLMERSLDPATKKWSNEEDAHQFRSLSQTISRLEGQTERYKKQLIRITALKELMVKLERVFRFKTESTREQVKMLEEELETNRAAAEAVESAQDAFGGGDDFAKLFEQSTAHVEGSIAAFTGTVDAFLLTAPRMLSDVDLEGDMAEMELLKNLDSWDARLEGLVAGAQSEQRALSSGSSATDLLHSFETKPQEGVPQPRRAGEGSGKSRYHLLGNRDDRSSS